MNLVKSGIKLTFSFGIKSILVFVGTVIFARLLSPDLLGTFFLFQALLIIISELTDLGVRGTLEKRISEKTNSEDILATGFFIKMVIFLLASVVLYLSRGVINSYVGTEVVFLLILTVLFHEVGYTYVQVLRGELRVGETAVLEILPHLIWLVLGIVFIYFDHGGNSIIYSLTAGYMILSIVAYSKVHTTLGFPTIESFRSITDYSRFYFVSIVGRYSNNWIDILIIGALITSTAVGIYEVSWRIAGITLLLSSAVASTIFPMISNMHEENYESKITDIQKNSLLFSLVLVTPAFFGIAVLSEYLLLHLFGEAYASAWLVLIILSFGKIPQSLNIVMERIILAVDRPDLAAKATLIGMLLNLILNIILISYIGILGAAIATTFSITIVCLINLRYINIIIGLGIPLRSISWIFASSVIMTLVVYMINNRYALTSLFDLIILISFSSLIYLLLLPLHSPTREKLYLLKNRVLL